jgi:hypothetical protein
MSPSARPTDAYALECHHCPWCQTVQRCLLTGRSLPGGTPAREYRCTTCGGTFARQGHVAVLGSPPIVPS